MTKKRKPSPNQPIEQTREAIEVNLFIASLCEKISVLLTETTETDVVESKWCIAIALYQNYLSIQSSEKIRNYLLEQCRDFLRKKQLDDVNDLLRK